jgi:hypothetical protein
MGADTAGGRPPPLPDGDEGEEGEEGDGPGDEEDRPEVHPGLPEEVGDGRPDDGAEGVEGPVDAEAPPPPLPGRRLGDDGVSGGRTDPLAGSLNSLEEEDLLPAGGEGEEELSRRREGVACRHQGLSPLHHVRPISGEELEEAWKAVGEAPDEADGEAPRAQ